MIQNLAQKIRMLRDHGSETRYHHDMIGYNARPDELQAVVLRAKLPHLNDWNANRRFNARLYEKYLADAPITTPYVSVKNLPVYHLYVIQTDRRDELQNYLKSKGIFTGIHYPIPIHLQKATEGLGYQKGDLPVTEALVEKILSLPMYAELEESEIVYISEEVWSFFHQ